MTREELTALIDDEAKLKALRDYVLQKVEITNIHNGEVDLPLLEGALVDAWKLGWKAQLAWIEKQTSIAREKMWATK